MKHCVKYISFFIQATLRRTKTVVHAGKVLGDITRVFGRLDLKPRMTVSPRVLFYVVVITAGPCCYTPNINYRRSIYGHGSYYLVCD